MKRHDSNIDPFNAGEPSMPWDSPSEQDAPGAACEFDEHGYSAPEHVPSRRSSGMSADADGARAKSRTRSERPGTGAAKTSTDATSPLASAAGSTAKRPRNKQEADTRRAKRKRRRIILIVVIIALFWGILGTVISCTIDLVDEANDSIVRFDLDLDSDFGQERDLTDEEQDAYTAASIVLSNLDDIDAAHAIINEWFEKDVVSKTGFTCLDLGIDSDDYADWLLENTACEITDVYAFTGNDDPSDDYASIYFNATIPDADSFQALFYDAFTDYRLAQGIAKGNALTQSQQEQIEELFESAMDNAEHESRDTGNLRLVYEDGSVHMTDSDLNSMLKSLYWLY